MLIANHVRAGVEQRASLQFLCDSAQQVDGFVSFEDRDTETGRVTHANHYAASSTASAAVVLAGPAPKNNVKDIEYLSFKALISNTVPVTVRVQLYDNVNAAQAASNPTYDLFSAQLSPGDTLVYQKNIGWLKTPASGSQPSTADLVTQLINELRTQFSSLGQNDILV